MFFFNKKHTIAASGILAGATDHHSHILPGVDDGVETMDEALRILATYETLGIKELWLTPHIMEDVPNTPDKLAERFVELQTAYKGNITLHLAAEYMIDNHLRKLLQEIKDSPSFERGAVQPEAFQETPPLFEGAVRNHSTACDDGYFSTPKECPQGSNPSEDRRGEKSPKEYPLGTTEGNQTNNCPSYVRGASDAVAEGVDITNTQGINSPSLVKREYPKGEGVETNNLLPIGKKGDHLLVETSYFNPPMRLKETLRLIKSLGYHPLLAHPERYMYMEKEEYLELHEEGIKFQLNLASLAGGYGKAVQKKALWLLSNGLYSVAGSDLHCENAIEYITNCMLSKQAIEQLGHLLTNKL